MAILSSNYNVLQCSASDNGNYSVGQIFEVTGQNRFKHRIMRFDGLEIKNITFGFGVFLHFEFIEWESNKNVANVPTQNESNKNIYQI